MAVRAARAPSGATRRRTGTSCPGSTSERSDPRERETGDAGRPALRAVLAHAEAVTESAAVEHDARDDGERLALHRDAGAAEPRDALEHHVPRDDVVADALRHGDGDRDRDLRERRHVVRERAARAVPHDGLAAGRGDVVAEAHLVRSARGPRARSVVDDGRLQVDLRADRDLTGVVVPA